MHDDLTAALAEFAALGAALDAKAGPAAPPTSAIRGALENVLGAINDVARAKLAVTVAPKAEDKKADGPDDAGPGGNGKPKDDEKGEKLPVVRNRDDALNAILQLGEYFRRTEPHFDGNVTNRPSEGRDGDGGANAIGRVAAEE